MNKINIWSVVVLSAVVCILSVFTTLFFVKRNIVPQETIAVAISNKVPEKVEVRFKPTKPDSTYVSDITIKKDGEEVNLLASKKTFREVLLSNDKKPVFSITSEVVAYATVPVDFIENNITIDTNKEQLQNAIQSSLPKQSSKFLKGFMYGTGVGAVVVGTVCILSK